MTRDSQTYGASSNETTGHPVKPVIAVLQDGREIDADHHLVSKNAPVVHLYIDGRDGGIDVTVPLANIDALARSDAGREALGINTDAGDDVNGKVDDGPRLVTDGGRALIDRVLIVNGHVAGRIDHIAERETTDVVKGAERDGPELRVTETRPARVVVDHESSAADPAALDVMTGTEGTQYHYDVIERDEFRAEAVEKCSECGVLVVDTRRDVVPSASSVPAATCGERNGECAGHGDTASDGGDE